MKNNISALWKKVPSDIEFRLASCLDEALEQITRPKGVRVFFRADDIGVPGTNFTRLTELFIENDIKIGFATVPIWMTTSRWQVMQRLTAGAPNLFCWHQHGWCHKNHETEGKKQEFGPARSEVQLLRDISQGRERLISIMDDAFRPIFTPPWNRCSSSTLNLLKPLNFRAVSRSRGSKPPAPMNLPDVWINIDLHTRKEKTPRAAWDIFLKEIQKAVHEQYCGFMIHHQRMNDAAFDFLQILIKHLKARKIFTFYGMDEMSYLN